MLRRNQGENVHLLGNQHEIGNWDETRAVGRFFNQAVYDYPTWYYDVAVPADRDITFKFAKIDGSGNTVMSPAAIGLTPHQQWGNRIL